MGAHALREHACAALRTARPAPRAPMAWSAPCMDPGRRRAAPSSSSSSSNGRRRWQSGWACMVPGHVLLGAARVRAYVRQNMRAMHGKDACMDRAVRPAGRPPRASAQCGGSTLAATSSEVGRPRFC
ncbi:hypothetical protein ZWY2020_036238 [Hordeum vulgare]|nr:hypothetical protein ZWY2020_036238 [Hordeum vulgare]